MCARYGRWLGGFVFRVVIASSQFYLVSDDSIPLSFLATIGRFLHRLIAGSRFFPVCYELEVDFLPV